MRYPVRNDDGKSIPELRERLAYLHSRQVDIQATADAAHRELNESETADLQELFDLFDATETEIARRERIIDAGEKLAQPQARKTIPEPPGAGPMDRDAGAYADRRLPPITQVESPQQKRQWGWNSLGEFALGVIEASRPGAQRVDNRLVIHNAPTTYGTEGVGADGGFAVPPEWRTEIMQKVMGEQELLPRTDQNQTSRNSVAMPIDETTPWQTTGGIQAYWENEASQLTESKPQLREHNVRLNKLTALVPVSNELIEDAPMMDSYIRNKAPQKINFKINRAIIAGTGVGQPLGILNSPALVTVSKESAGGAQAADTILFENLVKMYSRMHAPSTPRAVWLANQDVLPQLMGLGFPTAATAVPVWIPPGGLADSPFGRLLGRPIIFTEAAETLGDKGDIILADLTQYMTVLKVGGIRAEVSMHLYFDYDMLAFRFILRVGGSPWWSSVIAARSGVAGSTLSPFVTLEAR